MTESKADRPSGAREAAQAYFEAWSSKDIEAVMRCVADDIVCDAPGGRVEGRVAFREFWAGFMQILTGGKLIAAFGDDRAALVMYDTTTIPVAHAPAAEYLTVKDGKITASRIIFDRTPFAQARQSAA